VRFGGVDSECKAVLESEELLVRGDIRLKIPFRDVRSVGASNGILRVVWPGGEAELEVGPRAERWAERIRNPRTLADKLGLKPGLRVGVVEVEHEVLRDYGAPEPEADLIFVGAESRAELDRVSELAPLLAPAGGIWVVAPKGRPDPSENDVLAAGRAAGLTDVKVAKFSETHTAHKFVIPRDRRPKG
jgi:hypothetical protein